MKRCLDEGILQAYMDGELSPEAALETGAHLDACGQCASALSAAEGEGALFAAAFALDDSLSVPTEELRARINAAVARLDSQPETQPRTAKSWNLNALLASLSSLLNVAPQRAAAGFAGLLAVVVFAAVFFSMQKPSPAPNSPERESQLAVVTSPKTETNGGAEIVEGEDVPTASTPEIKKDGGTFKAAKFKPARAPKRRVREAEKATTPALKEQPLPGEKDYEQAIASLSTAIKVGGDAVLKPQVRAQYERNLAVLDKAIEETRRVARRNPKDKDAVDFLMSAYQSKVELLTTVADQAQVATLGR
jgi:hypothetical protein